MTDSEWKKIEQERIERCNNCKRCIRLLEVYADGDTLCDCRCNCRKFSMLIKPTLLKSCKYFKEKKHKFKIFKKFFENTLLSTKHDI